jgi:hypothetical protein
MVGWLAKWGAKKASTIKNVPIAKNLTTKRNIQDKVVTAVDEGTKKGLGGKKPSDKLKQSMSKTKRDSSKSMKDISYKWDKLVSDRKKADKKLVKQTVGGGAAAIAGTVGAHEGAKRKWPKYKKVMESDITIKDGKLGLKEKKKK